MKNKTTVCPRCHSSLNTMGDKPSWISGEDEDLWYRKQSLVFFDFMDGERYEIWNCQSCRYSWDKGDIKGDIYNI